MTIKSQNKSHNFDSSQESCGLMYVIDSKQIVKTAKPHSDSNLEPILWLALGVTTWVALTLSLYRELGL